MLVIQVFFHDVNAAMHVKVIAALNEGNVVVKECDISNTWVTGSDVIFNKELTKNQQMNNTLKLLISFLLVKC